MELSRLERPARDPRIEEYLNRVVNQLPQRMSPVCRQEHQEELAAHLQALVDAHVELGADQDRAVLVALQQFGCAKELGRQLSREWKRAAHLRASTGELAAVAGLCLYTGGAFACGFPTWPAVSFGPGVLGSCLDLLIPCLAGYYWGRHRSAGWRVPGALLLAGLIVSALLPLQQDYQSFSALYLAARLLLLMKWGIVGCSMAGLTVTLQTLGERWKSRRTA